MTGERALAGQIRPLVRPSAQTFERRLCRGHRSGTRSVLFAMKRKRNVWHRESRIALASEPHA